MASSINIPVLFACLLAAAGAGAAIGRRLARPAMTDAMLALLLCSCGAFEYAIHGGLNQRNGISGDHAAVIQVSSEPLLNGDRWRFTATVLSLEGPDGAWHPADSKVLVGVPADCGWTPSYGDRAAGRGAFRPAPQRRNPGGFDYRAYLELSGVTGIFQPEHVAPLDRHRGSWLTERAIIPARQYIRASIGRYLDGDAGALLSGLALGEKTGISKPVVQAFSNTGTTHILAVSGLHVVLVAFVLYLLLRALQMPSRWAKAATIAGLVLYTLITGAPASIVRATIMTGAVIAGGLFERRGSGLNMIGLAGLLILALRPLALFDVGFQLSFAATAGILALTRPIQEQLFRLSANPHLREWLLVPLAVSLAAQAFTAPLLAVHFHRIPMISLAANLVMVPLTNALLALGILLVMIAPLTLLAWPVAASAWLLSWLTLKAVVFFDAVTVGTIAWPRPDVLQVALYCLLLALPFAWARLGRRRAAAVILALLLANVIVWRQAVAPPEGLRVTFLDVGQGDAALVRFPNGRTMLVDAGLSSPGYDSGERAIVPFLRYHGIDHIDELVVSHGDWDHSGGLGHLLSRSAVKRLVISGHPPTEEGYVDALRTAVGSRVPIDTVAGYDTLDGIWPCRGFRFNRTDSIEDGNEASVVIFLQYGSVSFLLTGDMGPELEAMLARRGLLTRCTVLKVPHHGSRINNAPPVAARLAPGVAVFSVGERNRFGHPAPSVLETYRGLGSRIYRTDHSGAVTVETDGERYEVTTMIDAI